jgi:twitching motility protein PilT
MGSNLRTKESVMLGESEGKSFYEIIEASTTFGWRTFDHSCLDAYKHGIITEETALLFASKRGTVTRGIDLIKKARGEMINSVSELRMTSTPQTKTPPPANGKGQTSTHTTTLKLK